MLRAPSRVLRPRFAPFGGWSLAYAPARGLRLVSHSCLPPLFFIAGAGIPRPFGQSGFVGASPLSFFVGYRFESAIPASGGFPAVQLPAVCPPSAGLDCPPLVVLIYRLPPCATRPLFASWGFAPRCPKNPLMRGGLSAPLPLPPSVFHSHGLAPTVKNT